MTKRSVGRCAPIPSTGAWIPSWICWCDASLFDELTLDIAPVLLGSGERIFDGVESLGMEPREVLHSPLATHIRYRRAG
jgi:hypothetical protein